MTKARDIASAIPAPSTVSSAELGYLDGVTSAIQTQIDSKIGSASAINPTIVDAKGDIIAATAADTVARLAVGTNGQVLTAASGQATGLEWATPSSGGMTLLSTTNLSSTSTTVSGISGSYTDLLVVIQDATVSSGGAKLRVKPNAGFNAWLQTLGNNSATAATVIESRTDLPTTSNKSSFIINIYQYANTTYCKAVLAFGSVNPTATNAQNISVGSIDVTAAITSMEVTTSGGLTFNGGQILIYGVK